MKITWWSVAALEFKCPTVKSREKYTMRSEIVIHKEIVDQATKYIIYNKVQMINKILSPVP
jgi:hypothetical protein